MKKRSAVLVLAVLLVAVLPLGIIGHGGSTAQHGLNFDGTDDWVDVGQPASLNFERTDPFSVVARINATLATNGFIVAKQRQGASFRGYSFLLITTGALSVEIISSAAANSIQMVTQAGDVSATTWTSVGFSYDGLSSASGVRVYADGVNLTTTVSQDALVTTIQFATAFQVGTRASGIAPFPGLMDDVRVYNDTLTPAEFLAIHNGDESTLSPDANLVFQLRMNDGEGQTASDSSGNGNDGTLGSTGGADANDPLWETPICDAGEWWLAVPCPAQVIDQLPSSIQDIATDTTTSAAYEDVDGLELQLTVYDTSDIFMIATISANASGAATMGFKLVFNETDFHELERTDGSNPGNIVLIDLAEDLPAGTYVLKLQHRISAGTLTTFNTTIMAVSLHDGNGEVPSGQDFIGSETTVAVAALEEVDGLSFDVTTFTESFLWVGASFMGEVNAMDKHMNFTIVIDDEQQDIMHRGWDTANQKGAVSSLIRSNVRLDPGIHVVTAEWETEAGTTLTATNISIVAFAGEADRGDRILHMAKDRLSQDTTTATSMEDIDGLSLTAEPPASTHVFSTLSFWASSNQSSMDVLHTIEIDGADDVTMERGFTSAGTDGEGSIGQVARTASEVSSDIVIQGRWHTETDVTITGNAFVLTSVVLRTEKADPESAPLFLLLAAVIVVMAVVAVVAMRRKR